MRIVLIGFALLATAGCRDFLGGGNAPLRSAWIARTDSIGPGDWLGIPAAADGRLFVAIGNRIVAMSATNGAVLWSRQITTQPSPFSERILVRDGTVYVTDDLGTFALDPITGAVRWRFIPDSSTHRGGVEVDDIAVYVGSRDHRVWALARATGAELWSVRVHPEWEFPGIITGITAAGDTLFIAIDRYLNLFGGQSTGVVMALDRSNGTVIWEYETPGTNGAISSFPTVTENMIIASDDHGGAFFALSRTTGTLIWRVPYSAGAVGNRWSPIVIGNTAFSGDGYGVVFGVDATSGAARWQRDYDGTVVFGLGTCASDLIVQNLTLRRVATATGRQLGALNPPPGSNSGSVPVTLGRRIFLAGGNYVQAVDC